MLGGGIYVGYVGQKIGFAFFWKKLSENSLAGTALGSKNSTQATALGNILAT
jgi:hypothetical protein